MKKAADPPNLQFVLEAIANPIRLRILTLLGDGELCVCFVFAALEMPQAQISKQLASLRNAGMVSARREGKWMHYRAERLPGPLCAIVAEVLTLAAKQKDHMDDRTRLRSIVKNPSAYPAVLEAPKPTLPRACCV